MEARADLRAAVRRLMAVVTTPAVVVEVQRKDVELLLAVAITGRRGRDVQPPDLHPAQQ